MLWLWLWLWLWPWLRPIRVLIYVPLACCVLFQVDQNVSQNRDKEFWTTHFREAIMSIGHTLLVLSPWDNPTPLTRAWCLFEIYSTINDQVGHDSWLSC